MALHFQPDDLSNPIYKSHELKATPGPLAGQPRHRSSNLNPEDNKEKS